MTTPGRRGTVSHTQCPHKLNIQEGSNMEDIVKLFVDNGLSVCCVAYLIYFQSTCMKDMLHTLNAITDRLTAIETKIDEMHKG